jgi:hypothetical protein
MDDSRIVLIRDPYRIVAVTDDRDADKIVGYAILTAAGARVHYGLTLDDAKASIEDFISEDTRKRELESLAKKSKRRLR